MESNLWSQPAELQELLEMLEVRDKEVEMITDGARGGGDGRWGLLGWKAGEGYDLKRNTREIFLSAGEKSEK